MLFFKQVIRASLSGNKSRAHEMWLTCIAVSFMLTACTTTTNPLQEYDALIPSTVLEAPVAGIAASNNYEPERVEHGKYLVELLGCGSCHTDGALIGQPSQDKRLAGSQVGIAYSNPLEEKNPGIVFPSNLTTDLETGLGSWSDTEIIQMIRSGVDRHGKRQLSIMPWQAYSKISEQDSQAIVAYLRGLAPVKHSIPEAVQRGQKTTRPFIHFGVYRKRI
jgi:hypothetical protein